MTTAKGKARTIPKGDEEEAFRLYLIDRALAGDVLPFTGDEGKVDGYFCTNPDGKAYLLDQSPAIRVDSALAMGADVNVYGPDSEFHKLYVDDTAPDVKLPDPPPEQTPPSDEELAAAEKAKADAAAAEAKAAAAAEKAATK